MEESRRHSRDHRNTSAGALAEAMTLLLVALGAVVSFVDDLLRDLEHRSKR
jgi:hypothetical protein